MLLSLIRLELPRPDAISRVALDQVADRKSRRLPWLHCGRA